MGLAKAMADLLRSDVVAAGQIQEHIKPAELLELLNLPAPEPEIQVDIREYEDSEILDEAVRRFTLAEILQAIKRDAA